LLRRLGDQPNDGEVQAPQKGLFSGVLRDIDVVCGHAGDRVSHTDPQSTCPRESAILGYTGTRDVVVLRSRGATMRAAPYSAMATNSVAGREAEKSSAIIFTPIATSRG
jgi:hypothetical protein